ncbi:hypothetical protein [Bacillus cereus]|uniref:Uncharacterized protein n=1 Tax=Bacillus cereus VD184 TaxID=1053242 RepID=A0A9W5R4P9_BACCE|nr:hypothetical protein [Bacillus cereus]EOQ07799.1 hypothetical protein IKC_00028 [Bacillus cereus VD184]
MENVKWLEASENSNGITSIAMVEINKGLSVGRIVGYNGILKGEKVIYKDNEYTVVMASRLGHFGLSETGKLPYTICASPNEVSVCQQ